MNAVSSSHPAVSPPAPRLADMRRFGFLTLPNYSMIAAANALEACRMANYVSGTTDYSWSVVTLGGQPATASNGLQMQPTVPLSKAGELDIVFVCGGVDVRHAVDRRLYAALRQLSRQGVALGALCTGTLALADAGLLDGYRAAIHWENLSALRETFTGITFANDLFVIDRDRFTCTGGVAPLDMMAVFIEARFGRTVAGQVSDQFIVEKVRRPEEPQYTPVKTANPAVGQAVRLMTENIDAPLAVADIALALRLSERQVERLFRRETGQRPGEYYLGLRLDRARDLLRQTVMTVTAIGLASGFRSAAHFSTAYRKRFGHPPRAERLA